MSFPDHWLQSMPQKVLEGVARRNQEALAGDGTELMKFVQGLVDKGRIPPDELPLDRAREVATTLQQRLKGELARRAQAREKMN